MTTPTVDFERAWTRLIAGWEEGDHAATLAGLQDWILAWDLCFWARDLSAFPIAYHPDVEIINSTRMRGLGPSDGRGMEGFRQGREEVADVLSWFRFEVTGMRRTSEHLVGLGRIRARGRFSGIVLRFPFAAVWTIRDGKIARAEGFTSQRKALASAGLR